MAGGYEVREATTSLYDKSKFLTALGWQVWSHLEGCKPQLIAVFVVRGHAEAFATAQAAR